MQSVRQLNKNHANIACHRQQHLAKIFCLRVFFGFKLDAFQFTQSVDQIGYRLAKFFGNVFVEDVRVLHHVMQQCCHDGLRVEVKRSKDACDGDRVGDVKLPGLA